MQPQHPLASDARWGGTYRQNMKTLATIKDRIRTVKPDGEVVQDIMQSDFRYLISTNPT
jgi:hypothetical protein